MEDTAIRDLVTRLARPHPSGGDVIERAAIVAEGAHSTDVVAWIMDHDGKAEMAVEKSSAGGLYGSRFGSSPASGKPLRYVLPAGALNA